MFLSLTTIAYGGEQQKRCPICGMLLKGNENTAFVIEWKNGDETTYCCPHCGLWVVAQGDERILFAKTRDFISGEWVDAKKAFYLFNSKAVPACSPSWISFERKKDAERFQKGFGGEIYTYEEAIKKRAGMPKEMSQ
ncbi:MAG: hypothetical protein D6828_02380 [Nitrospirae bacterium]|nr:MAG: hypothetical protein D6828_02380 [Nitrospirota bacterium]